MKFAVFCDFDETVTRCNVTDTILARFADPLWLEIQEQWLAGKISARQVLEQQMPLVEVEKKKLDDLIDSVDVDPAFCDFAWSCAEQGDALYILSDGFDYWIERILRRTLRPERDGNEGVPFYPVPHNVPDLPAPISSRRAGLSAWDLPAPWQAGGQAGTGLWCGVYSCSLALRDNRCEISFPYFPGGCEHGCATCKPELFLRLRANGDKTIVIGDGRSDRLLAGLADFVIAKEGLKEFCDKEGIPVKEFEDFNDVVRIVQSLRENANASVTLL